MGPVLVAVALRGAGAGRLRKHPQRLVKRLGVTCFACTVLVSYVVRRARALGWTSDAVLQVSTRCVTRKPVKLASVRWQDSSESVHDLDWFEDS